MKLLLTSAGFENKKIGDFFVSILPKSPKECSVLMVFYIQDEETRFYIEQSKKELVDLGIGQIDPFDLNEEKTLDEKESFDVIYVCGGNTFSILSKIRSTGIEKIIQESVLNRGTIYVGVSAGSIIAGLNIEISGWGSEGDRNEIGLKDLSSFGFTNISIFPHFRPELKDEVEKFREGVENPIIEITDNEAVFIEDKKQPKII